MQLRAGRVVSAKLWRALLRDERGNVESALVLIPLLTLFLIGFQIAYVTHARNVARVQMQNEASVRAISGELLGNDRLVHIESSGDGQNLDLLITHRESTLLNFLPNLGRGAVGGRRADVSGIAIVENQR
jgi:hypothetical protein